METITQAAINHQGTVYTGRRHDQIIRDIVRLTGIKRVSSPQGFVTSTGRYVDREEAAKIALAAGQVKKLKYNPYHLFSEEIIP